jgi:Rha family phage regulatory protein
MDQNVSGSAVATIALEIRNEGGVPLVSSTVVAKHFKNDPHDNVMRDIKALEISSELGRSLFLSTTTPDTYGREQPSYDMTKDGFTLLVMGWTGKKALRFKVAYIVSSTGWRPHSGRWPLRFWATTRRLRSA